MVLVIPLCLVLQSTLQIIWRVEKQQWIASFSPFVFYVQLKPDAIQYEAESITETISKIEGLQLVHLDRSIPSWNGAPELSQQWEQLWEKYLPYFVYATSAANAPLQSLETTVGDIQNTPGVLSVEWDQERYRKLQRLATAQDRQGQLLYGLFSIWLFGISILFFFHMPLYFHRTFAVQKGFLGAGVYISPEWVMAKLIALHALISILTYTIFQSIVWYFFAFTLDWNTVTVYMLVLIEGLITSAALPSALIMVAWWIPKKTYVQPWDIN
jgi:hypothetical protein